MTASRSPAQLSSPEGRRTGQGFALFGSGFLNNRYHDPMLAAFISVYPLVGKTGDPYLHSSGSPITLSDPSGLDDEFNLIGALGEWVVEQQQNEIAHNCILSERCDGQELVDAIDETMDDGLGGLVFGTIDVANQGDWDKGDGNWNPNDFRAAAEGEHVIQLLLDLGFEPHVAYELANLIMSVAQRLQDDNDIYEDIDEEQSWWERNADTVMKVVGVISLVAGIVSLGQCLYCSYFGVVSLIGSAATTGYACSQGDKTGCALGVVSLGVASFAKSASGPSQLAGQAAGAAGSSAIANYAAGNGVRWYVAAAAQSHLTTAANSLNVTGQVLKASSVAVDAANVTVGFLS